MPVKPFDRRALALLDKPAKTKRIPGWLRGKKCYWGPCMKTIIKSSACVNMAGMPVEPAAIRRRRDQPIFCSPACRSGALAEVSEEW